MIQVKGMEFCSQTEFVLLKYALDYCPEAITVNYVDKTWLGRLMIHFSLRTTCFSNGRVSWLQSNYLAADFSQCHLGHSCLNHASQQVN